MCRFSACNCAASTVFYAVPAIATVALEPCWIALAPVVPSYAERPTHPPVFFDVFAMLAAAQSGAPAVRPIGFAELLAPGELAKPLVHGNHDARPYGAAP
jgi:hypothetical protein